MKVFITGATGYIGRAVAKELRAAGHEVTALVRPDRDPSLLRSLGVSIVAGGLSNMLEHGILTEIEKHEVFVHAAQSQTPDMIAFDEAAVEAFLRFRDGGRYFIYTSGVWVLGNSGSTVDDEAAPPNPIAVVAWRPKHEQYVLEAMRDEFPTAVLRPGCVYGRGQSLLRNWFASVAQDHPIEIVGDGKNRWAMVHIDELAALYRLAIERKHTGVLHGTDDSRATLNEMAAAVIGATGSKSSIVHISADEARKGMGPFTDALLIDQQVASGYTRQELGWSPKRTFVGSVKDQWKEWGEA
jgi:nucleoside-diphosphate-sugar epimerase